MKRNHVALLVLITVFSSLFSLALAQANDAATVYDDATQSRLRIAHFVFDGPGVDVLVNGEVAVISERPWANVLPGEVTGYLYLEPATYSVAVVPTGEAATEAVVGPLKVEVAPGHRYTVAVMGQMTDEELEPLVIDEMAEVQEVRTDPKQTSTIWLHNVAGVETVNFGEEMGFAGDVNYGCLWC